eukprot:COSAG02_NODE_18644_length_927_cov_1.333333_2_plen_26_part_01
MPRPSRTQVLSPLALLLLLLLARQAV